MLRTACSSRPVPPGLPWQPEAAGRAPAAHAPLGLSLAVLGCRLRGWDPTMKPWPQHYSVLGFVPMFPSRREVFAGLGAARAGSRTAMALEGSKALRQMGLGRT